MGRSARGVRGVTLRRVGDAVVGCEAVSGDEVLLIVCENGYGKRSRVEDFRKAHRGGVGVRSIIANDRNGLVVAGLCVTDEDSLLMVSSSGQTIRIALKDIRVMGRNTQGVRLANLKGAQLVAIQRVEACEGDESPEIEEGAEAEELEAPEAEEPEAEEPESEEPVVEE